MIHMKKKRCDAGSHEQTNIQNRENKVFSTMRYAANYSVNSRESRCLVCVSADSGISWDFRERLDNLKLLRTVCRSAFCSSRSVTIKYRSQFSLNTAIFPFVSYILWHLSITNQSKTTVHISANYVIYYQKINQVKTCNLCPKI